MAECECCECVYHADDGCKCGCHLPICSVCDEQMCRWNEDDEGNLCCLKCEEEEARAEEEKEYECTICKKSISGDNKCFFAISIDPYCADCFEKEEDGDGFVICSKCGKGGGKCDGECESDPVAEK